MMDVQPRSCFRPTTAIPHNSSTNALTLAPHGVHGTTRTDHSPKYNFHRSNSYTGNMVVESQTLNFRPMTPDTHPDNMDQSDNGKHNLPSPRISKKLSMPPEGALTPSDEPMTKKPRLQMPNDDMSLKEGIDFLSVPPNSNYPSSPLEMRKDKMDLHFGMNGLKFNEKMLREMTKEMTNVSEENGSDDPSSMMEKQRKLADFLPMKAELLEAAFKIGLDKSPPTLSPKTMSDIDFEDASMGSPSVSISGERKRRKPNLEDIVRRMREVETDYSEDSDAEEEYHEQIREQNGADEVDGDLSVRIPTNMTMTNQMNDINTMNNKINNYELNNEISPKKMSESDFNENNNIINKLKNRDEFDKENMNEDKKLTEDGIPLPASAKSDAILNGDSDIKPSHSTPNKANGNNGWLHGAFNGFPMFPFQASPPEMPFANFMSPFENKFTTPELEKDYLKCQYCERTFRRQKNLENHTENTHHGKVPTRKKSGENPTGEMYFKCTHCPYTTKHQSNLYVHLRIHTGERPYICGACGVQYSQSHSLKSHIINKHDGIMSYYIKEKRTRSPRGLGYLASHSVSSDSPMFKLPASPMIPSSMGHLPGNPNGLHLQHSPPQQQKMSLQHSPLGINLLAMQQHNTPSSVPQSPVMSPNHPRQPQRPQMSPNGPQQAMQMSPHMPMHRPPFPPFPHGLPEMDIAQKSMELAKLGLMNFPYYGNKMHSKPSPPFPMNGQGPMSPTYNGLHMQMRQQQQQQLQALEQSIQATGGHQALQQYHNNNHNHNNPLQEIHENKLQDENGAIDLTKKGKEEALDLAIAEKGGKCSADDIVNCLNCLHLLKLKMLRMNVVRMLSILVPNLNFEEKGINAEGDSVDDLLRDVIESNIHDEDSNE